MIDGVPVIDGVIHGFDFRRGMGVPDGIAHTMMHVPLSPRGPEYADYVLTAEQFEKQMTPEAMCAVVFAETPTDVAVYHDIRRIDGSRKNAISPLEIGLGAREIAPGRVLIYGAVNDPHDTARSIEEIDELVDVHECVGLKFYPADWSAETGKEERFLLDDVEAAYPLLEHAVSRGIKVIGVHKAMGARISAYGVADLDQTCIDFPMLNFEVVHAGWAFLEETSVLAERPNIYLNLEGTMNFLAFAPRRFAHAIGRFIQRGPHLPNAEDRIIWATGATAAHPRPFLEMFWNFEIPQELQDDYGYPELTKEIKRKILADNFARMHGLDLDALLAQVPDDDFAKQQRSGELAEPWSAFKEAV